MGKIIFWFFAILVILTVWRMINSRQQGNKTPPPAQKSGQKGAQNLPADPLVRCAHCGIHLPRSEALQVNGQTWCSQEHARLGPR